MNWTHTAGALVIFVTASVASVAQAADPSAVYGKWIERASNGRGMVTEFTPTSSSWYPIDELGKTIGPVNSLPAKFKSLGETTVSMEFADGGGIILVVKDHDHLLMDFPGAGAHPLERLKP
jgi:hypothetical protein